jgi:hypothetical protein
VAATLGVGPVGGTGVLTYQIILAIIDKARSTISIEIITKLILSDEVIDVSMGGKLGCIGVFIGEKLFDDFPHAPQNFAPTRMGA